jgi:AcrR family transcriptional regulator
VTHNPAPGSPPSARRRRDSAATKRRLLVAATEEFAERGVAGARVDRIAAAAQANKRLIYDYFGDKDGLFDAVNDAYINRIVDSVPIDADDLPGYAGRLFDYLMDNPDLLRLLTWARLERRATPDAKATTRGDQTRSAPRPGHDHLHPGPDPRPDRKPGRRLARHDDGLPGPERGPAPARAGWPAQDHHQGSTTDAHRQHNLSEPRR